MHMIHALATCQECGKIWDSYNAMGVAARHNKATGHKVLVEVAYAHIYEHRQGTQEEKPIKQKRRKDSPV